MTTNSSSTSTLIPCPLNNKMNPLIKNLFDAKKAICQDTSSKADIHYYTETLEIIKYLEDNRIISDTSFNYESENEIGGDRVIIAHDTSSPTKKLEKINRRTYLVNKISLYWNIALLVAKIIACFYSHSIAIISSTLDSAVDIFSSVVTFFTNYKMRKIDIYKHPQGKARLVPLSIIIISCVMSITSFQIITESARRIVTGNDLLPDFSYVAIGIVVATIVSKLILFFLCHFVKNPIAQVLAQDHKNDVLTNITVLLGLVLSKYVWEYFDAVCAMLISTYVCFNWMYTGKSNLGALVGKTAPQKLLQIFGWVCLLYDPENILFISTLRAYAFGNRYLVEIDIVLDPDMPLSKAHDIGEGLQRKLESLQDVERAFVHLDFEKDHDPFYEHRLGVLY